MQRVGAQKNASDGNLQPEKSSKSRIKLLVPDHAEFVYHSLKIQVENNFLNVF